MLKLQGLMNLCSAMGLQLGSKFYHSSSTWFTNPTVGNWILIKSKKKSKRCGESQPEKTKTKDACDQPSMPKPEETKKKQTKDACDQPSMPKQEELVKISSTTTKKSVPLQKEVTQQYPQEFTIQGPIVNVTNHHQGLYTYTNNKKNKYQNDKTTKTNQKAKRMKKHHQKPPQSHLKENFWDTIKSNFNTESNKNNGQPDTQNCPRIIQRSPSPTSETNTRTNRLPRTTSIYLCPISTARTSPNSTPRSRSIALFLTSKK